VLCLDGIQRNLQRTYAFGNSPFIDVWYYGESNYFSRNNQLPRNLFGCGQAKQAVSLYHSNFINRIDKMGIVLNYGQKPIVRTQYFNYIHEEQHPYGEM